MGKFLLALVVFAIVTAGAFYGLRDKELRVAVAGIEKNCGIVPLVVHEGEVDFNTHFTEEQKAAWSCMTEALDSCTPASITFDGDQYVIRGKSFGACMVSGRAIGESGGRSVECALSDKLIDSAYEEFGAAYPGLPHAISFQALAIVTAGGGLVNLPDGSTEKVECLPL